MATSTTTGPSRVTSTGPWYQERSGGSFVLTYNNVANLQTGGLAALETDEQGRVISNSFTGAMDFWTGMNNDATTSQYVCSNWASSSSASYGAVGTGVQLAHMTNACDESSRLLCLEQSRLPRPPPQPTTRKRVFLTSTRFNGALGGLAGADQRCQTAATAGNKGGTWIAFLATSTTAGPSRVTSTGPWYQERSGGAFVLTYNNVANLQTGGLATLDTDEQGRVISNTFTGAMDFWTGMKSDGTTSQYVCSNWASSSSASYGAVGTGVELGRVTNACDESYRLVCMEQ